VSVTGTGNGKSSLTKALLWLLSVGAFLVLGAAAVWMGGLNQDEGWYLYAANLVHEGQTLYRDFAYTQGPLMPIVYSGFTWIWNTFGLLGARVFTFLIGALGIVFFCDTARRLAPEGRRQTAAIVTFLLLGANLYHLYYLAIPKTYALASLCVAQGFWLLSRRTMPFTAAAAFVLALAAGARISTGALLPVVGVALLLRREWIRASVFALAGFAGLAFAYGSFLLDPQALAGLVAAQKYHAARGGFDVVWTVGSFSRLVRWYLPVFTVFGLGVVGLLTRGEDGKTDANRWTSAANLLLAGFLAVFVVQMMAPFPYEDYQVPVMGLLAVSAAVTFLSSPAVTRLGCHASGLFPVLLVLGLSFASSFGSPLLESWMTNGKDRFWSLKKEKCELAQLRDVAKRIKALDPDGTCLLTQDTYLAVETGRKVPKGLEMGPFSILSDAEWRKLLTEIAPAECRLAALSGYTFAVEPPKCNEREIDQQLDYWELLKEKFELVGREDAFGQQATPLLLLKRK